MNEQTYYVAVCPKCGAKDIRTEHPPQERHCAPCGVWYPFVPVKYELLVKEVQ